MSYRKIDSGQLLGILMRHMLPFRYTTKLLLDIEKTIVVTIIKPMLY